MIFMILLSIHEVLFTVFYAPRHLIIKFPDRGLTIKVNIRVGNVNV